MPRLFVILLLALSVQSQTTTGIPGTVQGRITDAQTGDGIEGATLQLFPRNSVASGQPPRTTSLSGGIFRFDSVAPGGYFLFVRHPNYTIVPSSVRNLSVADGQQVTDLALQLNALGVISGKVLDDTHQPVAGMQVQLFGSSSFRGRPQLRLLQTGASNERGEFLFKKITPGRYYLVAAGRENSDPHKGAEMLRTFYPNATTLENAGVLEVAPAGSAAGADIQLQRGHTFHVRGRVENLAADSVQKGSRVTLNPRDVSPSDGLGRSARLQADGAFDLARVSAGSYTLWLVGSYAADPARRSLRRRALARQDIDVEGSDLNGVTLSLLPPVNLTGQIVLVNPPSGVNLSQLRLNLTPARDGALGTMQSIAPDPGGGFTVQDLAPGAYMARVVNIPAGMYVQSILLNRQDVAQTGLDFSQGGGGELDITLRTGTAEVDGNLTPQQSSAVVLLIPEVLPDDASGILSGTVQPGGTFAITNVPPGRYVAFAVERWSSLWQNADFLRAIQRDGQSMQVRENGHLQIQLALSKDDQVQNTAARLGLAAQ